MNLHGKATWEANLASYKHLQSAKNIYIYTNMTIYKVYCKNKKVLQQR